MLLFHNRSVNQSADRQLSQTSRQPKPSRLQQPQARYRQLKELVPTNWRQDVEETSDACAEESYLHPGPVIHKPSRIPVRDPTHLFLDMPTTAHRMPITKQQEMDHPTAYDHTTEGEDALDESTSDWESQQHGGRTEADVLGQVDVMVGTASVKGSLSQPVMHRSGSTLSEDQSETTPNGGQAHPIHFSSHRTQRETDTLGQSTAQPAEE